MGAAPAGAAPGDVSDVVVEGAAAVTAATDGAAGAEEGEEVLGGAATEGAAAAGAATRAGAGARGGAEGAGGATGAGRVVGRGEAAGCGAVTSLAGRLVIRPERSERVGGEAGAGAGGAEPPTGSDVAFVEVAAFS